MQKYLIGFVFGVLASILFIKLSAGTGTSIWTTQNSTVFDGQRNIRLAEEFSGDTGLSRPIEFHSGEADLSIELRDVTKVCLIVAKDTITENDWYHYAKVSLTVSAQNRLARLLKANTGKKMRTLVGDYVADYSSLYPQSVENYIAGEELHSLVFSFERSGLTTIRNLFIDLTEEREWQACQGSAEERAYVKQLWQEAQD